MLSRKSKPSYYFNGKKLYRLGECIPHTVLSFNEIEEWNALKDYLKDNSIIIWTTIFAWDNFLNNVIKKDQIPNFINYLDDFIKKFPADMYNLTENSEIHIVRLVYDVHE